MSGGKNLRVVLFQAGGSFLAILVSFVVCGLLMLAIKINPIAVYGRLAEGVLFNPYGIAQIFFKATPLIFTGLSVAFAFRAGMFNIGAEGQMIAGGFLCAWCGFTLSFLPAAVHVPLCLAGAFAGGMLWALVPGWLKARTGAHEVITTIMMNFTAAALTNYLVTARFHEVETVHTQSISSSAALPRLDILASFFKGSPANVSFFIALAACVVIGWMLWKTPLGFELRAVGHNPWAAETAGIKVGKSLLLTFLVSGGLAGLASVNFVMGYKHYFEDGFAGGTGFMGIAVALLGQNHPVGVVLAALLFGALSHGTLVVNALVPKEVILVLQALVIIFVIVFNSMAARYAAAGAGGREARGG